ncbi:M81 family metallopeptidase [Phytoactinopolyspora alkaliphila]|uniref:M81 family metallopeptidase n=1 Tax=Phytoactinopolyspora alkaliphila TaxID=1783498 RepID=A0A6N9YSG5_9ACTN|nr:M81 family metallopeptidase [Phytoactinopolyspora alkaliphila]
MVEGEAIRVEYATSESILAGFFAYEAEQSDVEVVPLVFSWITPTGASTTEAFEHLTDRMIGALEKHGPFDGVSVSVVEGFPYADIAEMGLSVVVVTDDDAGLAEDVAGTIVEAAWGMREEMIGDAPSVDDALRAAAAEPEGPVVVLPPTAVPGSSTSAPQPGSAPTTVSCWPSTPGPPVRRVRSSSVWSALNPRRSRLSRPKACTRRGRHSNRSPPS